MKQTVHVKGQKSYWMLSWTTLIDKTKMPITACFIIPCRFLSVVFKFCTTVGNYETDCKCKFDKKKVIICLYGLLDYVN